VSGIKAKNGYFKRQSKILKIKSNPDQQIRQININITNVNINLYANVLLIQINIAHFFCNEGIMPARDREL